MAKTEINIPVKEFSAFLQKYPQAIAITAQNHSRKNWERQGYYEGATFNRWKGRKRETRKTRGKAVLVSSGNLRQGIKATTISASMVVIKSTARSPSPKGFDYGSVHNEGISPQPKRTFLNDNAILGKELEKTVSLLLKRFKI